MAVTHLVVSLLLIQLLTLDRNDAFVALTFGVLIDLDHLFGLKDYVAAQGVAGLYDFDSLMHADGQWKSMLHNPVAVMVVGPVATASRLALPLLFWGVHMVMDFAEDSFLGLFSAAEIGLLACAGFALCWLSYRGHRLSEPDMDLPGFFSLQVRRLFSPAARVMRATSRALGR